MAAINMSRAPTHIYAHLHITNGEQQVYDKTIHSFCFIGQTVENFQSLPISLLVEKHGRFRTTPSGERVLIRSLNKISNCQFFYKVILAQR